jgi:hypothetical protein
VSALAIIRATERRGESRREGHRIFKGTNQHEMGPSVDQSCLYFVTGYRAHELLLHLLRIGLQERSMINRACR